MRALASRTRAVRPTPSLSLPVLNDPWDPPTGLHTSSPLCLPHPNLTLSYLSSQADSFRPGPELFWSIIDFYSRLEWSPIGSPLDCPWTEIALDFETSYGISVPIHLPVSSGRSRIPPRGSLTDKGWSFCTLSNQIKRAIGAPLWPAHVKRSAACQSSRFHGIPPRWGLSARPAPLGQNETRQVWRQWIGLRPDPGVDIAPPVHLRQIPERPVSWADHIHMPPPENDVCPLDHIITQVAKRVTS